MRRAISTAVALSAAGYTHAGIHYTRNDGNYIADLLDRYPDDLAQRIARRYCDEWGQHGSRRANINFRETIEQTGRNSLRLAASDEAVIDFANARARQCRAQVNRQGEDAHDGITAYLDAEGYRVPDGPAVTNRGRVARYVDPIWWRRAVRVRHGRTVEAVARRVGMVHAHAGIYCSNDTVTRRRQQKARNRNILEAIIAINEMDDRYTLQELSDLSVSNPVIRRSELMVRMSGFELIAKQSGHVAEFYTVTTPSKFHATHSSGTANKKYNGSTPREAQAHLQGTWQRIRAALKRRGLYWYGFRVAEPHQDGTPHWHLLLFMEKRIQKLAGSLIHDYSLGIVKPRFYRGSKNDLRIRPGTGVCWLDWSGGELGAEKHRFTSKTIDWERGTATGYIAKYIAKNIDGYGLDADLYGTDINQAVERVDAWASMWGIRQFQQLGGPPVTVWRELRRINTEEEGDLNNAVLAADSGDWAGFVSAMGGISAGRGQHPIKTARLQEINTETGEMPQNRYGEIAEGKIIGVEVGGVVHLTRWDWTIEKSGKNGQINRGGEFVDSTGSDSGGSNDLHSVVGLGFDLEGATAPPWSSVNKCTQPDYVIRTVAVMNSPGFRVSGPWCCIEAIEEWRTHERGGNSKTHDRGGSDYTAGSDAGEGGTSHRGRRRSRGRSG